MSHREHGKITAQFCPTPEPGTGAALRLGYCDRLLGQESKPALSQSPNIGQQADKILTLDASWHEHPRAGRSLIASLHEPVPEVMRVIGEGSHSTCRHVDFVIALERRIGNALAKRSTFLHQRDMDIRLRIAQQVQCQENAARASADDRDGAGTHERLSAFSSGYCCFESPL